MNEPSNESAPAEATTGPMLAICPYVWVRGNLMVMRTGQAGDTTYYKHEASPYSGQPDLETFCRVAMSDDSLGVFLAEVEDMRLLHVYDTGAELTGPEPERGPVRYGANYGYVWNVDVPSSSEWCHVAAPAKGETWAEYHARWERQMAEFVKQWQPDVIIGL